MSEFEEFLSIIFFFIFILFLFYQFKFVIPRKKKKKYEEYIESEAIEQILIEKKKDEIKDKYHLN